MLMSGQHTASVGIIIYTPCIYIHIRYYVQLIQCHGLLWARVQIQFGHWKQNNTNIPKLSRRQYVGCWCRSFWMSGLVKRRRKAVIFRSILNIKASCNIWDVLWCGRFCSVYLVVRGVGTKYHDFFRLFSEWDCEARWWRESWFWNRKVTEENAEEISTFPCAATLWIPTSLVGHVCHQDLFCGDKPKGVLVGDAWRYQSQTWGTVMWGCTTNQEFFKHHDKCYGELRNLNDDTDGCEILHHWILFGWNCIHKSWDKPAIKWCRIFHHQQ